MKDPKRIVEEGYDAISDRYTSLSLEWDWPARRHYLRRLIDLVPAHGAVLELGCGAGIPATAELTRHFQVTAVDISREQLRRAIRNAPGAQFIHGDMATVELPEAAFDGVAAFYSIAHLPRDEHPLLLKRIRRWLRPGGIFVASMAARDTAASVEPDWLGAPMYFSHFDATTNMRLLTEAGFVVEESDVITQDEGALGRATFCWVVATAAMPS
jgi:SAM-dependent methyltransferase